MNRPRALVLISAGALALVLSATPCRAQGAQGAQWDQARVTKLAVEYADAVGELQAAFRREAPPHVAPPQARARNSFRDSLRVLVTESRALASELEAGAGMEETWPIVRRSGGVIRDLQEEGRRMSWAEPVVGHARRAQELIGQIAPFYATVGAE